MIAPLLGRDVRPTIGEIRAALQRAGVEEAALEARLLLEETTGRSWAELLAHPDDPISPALYAQLYALVARRVSREPLAYVLGHAQFRGLRLAVDQRVLVPRPETELLAGLAIDRCSPGDCVVDVGTGSGAIALAVASERPDVSVLAVDVSTDALAVARANRAALALVDRVMLVRSDLLAALRPGRYCVLANLPYVSDADLATAQPELGWEPPLALAGGVDGLDVYRRLFQQAAEVLTGGWIACEIGAGQATAMASLARRTFPDAEVRTVPDYAGLDRFVVTVL